MYPLSVVFHPHLRLNRVHNISVVFCFTPTSATFIIIFSLSSFVSPPSQSHPHSSFLFRLLCHPHLRLIHIHHFYIVCCFHSHLPLIHIRPLSIVFSQTPPNFVSFIFIISLPSSVPPHLHHIHIHPTLSSFTPISATSSFFNSQSSSVSLPPPTLPCSSFLCRLLFHPHLGLIDSHPFSVVYCFTPTSESSMFNLSLSSSISPVCPPYP